MGQSPARRQHRTEDRFGRGGDPATRTGRTLQPFLRGGDRTVKANRDCLCRGARTLAPTHRRSASSMCAPVRLARAGRPVLPSSTIAFICRYFISKHKEVLDADFSLLFPPLRDVFPLSAHVPHSGSRASSLLSGG